MTSITLTTRDIATAHSVSLRTAQRWARNGKLTAAKTGGRWTITLTADVDGYKPAQLDKAREAIEQGAILPTSRPGMYTAVSFDGSTTYLVHQAGCTCPAGQRGRYACYHRAAVALLAAARRAA